jgi:hypothetical protein
MMRILLILLFTSNCCFAQSKYSLKSLIPVQPDFFTTDNQGNIYVAIDQELFKYNKDGKQLYKYSNNKYGKISFVDASNMMRLVVFYREFSQAFFLDNTLSLIGEPVSFDKLGMQQVNLVCNSFNSGIWIFDQQNTALVQFNPDYQIQQQTANLSALLNTELQPTALLEYDNKLYLNNPKDGIMIFDIYGTYYKTIPAKNISSFQPQRDQIFYLQGNEIKSYNLKTTEESIFEIPAVNPTAFRLGIETLYLLTEKGIEVWE